MVRSKRSTNIDSNPTPKIFNPTKLIQEYNKLIKQNKKAINLIAFGDSWLSFPGRNTLTELMNIGDYNVIKRVESGEEAINLLSGQEKFDFIEVIEKCSAQIILFSGGGNDIVGRYDFELFLQKSKSQESFHKYLCFDRIKRRLNQIENAYRDLVDYTLTFSKSRRTIKIVTHSYDYAYPRNKGVDLKTPFGKIVLAGPWMYPYLERNNIPKKFHKRIVEFLIDSFADRLYKIQKDFPDRFYIAQTLDTLEEKDWQDELHPTDEGFKKIAEKVHICIKRALG